MEENNRGFSLIELMIVVSILAIVTTWGYGSYRDTVLKSHRAEAKGELLMLADKMERYFSNQGTYIGAQLGTATNNVHPLNSANGYYAFTLSPSTLNFTATATPTTEGGQNNDTKCTSFTYNSNGKKTATGTDGDNCW